MRQDAELTRMMKKTITDLDLIDTGDLWRSIEVYWDTTKDEFIIDIRSEDYIKYHVEGYRIAQTFSNQNGFSKRISDLWTANILKIVQNAFQTGQFIWNPKITILFNGE